MSNKSRCASPSRFLVRLAIASLFLPPTAAIAADWETENFLQQVLTALEQTPPPAMTEIVPDYSRPEGTPTGLVVADLENAPGTEGDWGKAVGQILRWDLAYAYRPALRTADFGSYYQDAFTPDTPRAAVGRSSKDAALAAARLGLDHTLAGRIAVGDSRFELALTLQRVADQGNVETFRMSGALAELPGALDGVAPRVYAALGLGAPDAQPQRAALLNAEKLQELVTALSVAPDAPRDERAERVQRLWADGVQTPLTAAHRLQYIEVSTPQAYLDQLDAVRAQFPDDDGLDLMVARLAPFRDGLLESKRQRLARLIVRRPHDPTPMLILADAYSDSENALGGVALAREAARRWPENYRSWWALGYALMEYGWEQRGTGYWQDVPKAGQNLFPVLKRLAGRAADKALARQRDNSNLWVLKMYTIGAYGDEFMQAYETAIRLDPQNRRAYEMALNYTLPQWGGSYEIQYAVWAAAEEAISDPTWRDKMRAMYVGQQPFGQRWMHKAGRLAASPIAWTLLTLVVLVAGLIFLRRREG